MPHHYCILIKGPWLVLFSEPRQLRHHIIKEFTIEFFKNVRLTHRYLLEEVKFKLSIKEQEGLRCGKQRRLFQTERMICKPPSGRGETWVLEAGLAERGVETILLCL